MGFWVVWETSVSATPRSSVSKKDASNDEILVANDVNSSVDTTVKLKRAIAESTFSFTALDVSVVALATGSIMPVEEPSIPATHEATSRHILRENLHSKALQPIAIAAFLQQNPTKRTKAAALLLPVHATSHQAQSDFNETAQPIAAAGPENFNPGLAKPTPPPLTPPLPPPSAPTSPSKPSPPVFDLEPAPLISFENLHIDFRSDRDNFGQRNQFIEPTLQFRFGEEPALFQLKTGFNTFKQHHIETITNIPLQLGWQAQFGAKKVQVAAGIDLFNRLPTAWNLNAQITIPVTQALTFFGVLEQGPYKANAETLNNQINAWRFGPNFYWQIDPHTSLFSSFRLGFYNDGNREEQSFNRLERRFGQFYVAANVFNWTFSDDVQDESGYFSPPDFLVYNGEIGWEGNPFEFLRCHLNTNLGRQRLNGRTTNGNAYQARCTVKLARQVELDFGYAFTNVANRSTGDRVYGNHSLLGQLRVNF